MENDAIINALKVSLNNPDSTERERRGGAGARERERKRTKTNRILYGRNSKKKTQKTCTHTDSIRRSHIAAKA